MTYNEKLIGQWLEMSSPKRAGIAHQYLLDAEIRKWMRCSREEYARHRERWEYRKMGLRPPLYSMAVQPRPRPIHPVFLLGDSLNELVNKTFIW